MHHDKIREVGQIMNDVPNNEIEQNNLLNNDQ